ncbi:hypothetical protein [Kordiimonas aquimaris]|uniref:hypothetical protein n=1 Tax=Kordiimonas aquimaris TaxID=707591 RepID=UPI0021D32909|nr:hypothetical protein [Kordiimonas aquimaris]
MSFGARHTGVIKAASFTALLAWIMLQAISFAHADTPHHSDLPNNHCVACSHGASDDELITPTVHSFKIAAISAEVFSLPLADNTAPQHKTLTHLARGPPQA